jgi:hypothetical protein
MHAHCFHLGSQLTTNYQTKPIFKISLAIYINHYHSLQTSTKITGNTNLPIGSSKRKMRARKSRNILVPLIWIGPETSSETYDLSKISWTTVLTDSHSTFIITSNIECIISRSRCLAKKKITMYACYVTIVV